MPQDAQASNAVVTGTLQIDSVHMRVLFDSGATHSFISPYCVTRLGRDAELLDSPIVVATLAGDSIEVTRGVRACPLVINGQTYHHIWLS